MTNSMEIEKSSFVDLYDFLGIPPGSPPNLIYLAILKLESSDWKNLGDITQKENFAVDMERNLAMVKDRLLSTITKRQAYEQEWGYYYYPISENQTEKQTEKQTNVAEFCERSKGTSLLSSGLRKKSEASKKFCQTLDFDYKNDFFYFMMRDFPGEGDAFFLNTEQEVTLPPLEDILFFENRQFHLKTFSKNKNLINPL